MKRCSVAAATAVAIILAGCGTTGIPQSQPLPCVSTDVPATRPGTPTPACPASSRPSAPTSPTGMPTTVTRTTSRPATTPPGTTVATTVPAPATSAPVVTSPASSRPAPTGARPTSVHPTSAAPTDWSRYSNNDLSWWYRPPTPWGLGKPATIDPDVARLIAPHEVVWQVPTHEKVVYLTMDEGYEFEHNTSEILDIAAGKHVPITFFITGSYLRNNAQLVRRMVAEGHQVANHSEKHLRPAEALATSTQTFVDEIRHLERDYQQVMGRPITKLYRPPEGGYSQRSLAVTDDLGYTTVFWSFAYADWDTAKQPDPTAARNKILGELHPGSVILLHAVSDTNVAILADLVDQIRARGYTIAPLLNG